MIPQYRLCQYCHDRGLEHRIGTPDEPVIGITVGLMKDGLAAAATLPRWLWRLWSKYNGQADQLEQVPLKFEFGAECLDKLIHETPGEADVVTQEDYCSERRAEFRAALAALKPPEDLAAGAGAPRLEQLGTGL